MMLLMRTPFCSSLRSSCSPFWSSSQSSQSCSSCSSCFRTFSRRVWLLDLWWMKDRYWNFSFADQTILHCTLLSSIHVIPRWKRASPAAASFLFTRSWIDFILFLFRFFFWSESWLNLQHSKRGLPLFCLEWTASGAGFQSFQSIAPQFSLFHFQGRFYKPPFYCSCEHLLKTWSEWKYLKLNFKFWREKKKWMKDYFLSPSFFPPCFLDQAFQLGFSGVGHFWLEFVDELLNWYLGLLLFFFFSLWVSLIFIFSFPFLRSDGKNCI